MRWTVWPTTLSRQLVFILFGGVSLALISGRDQTGSQVLKNPRKTVSRIFRKAGC